MIHLGIDFIGRLHFDWVERMGWHNKTRLEALALIASEVGEAVAECCQDNNVTSGFSTELADIFLRVSDLATEHSIDLSAVWYRCFFWGYPEEDIVSFDYSLNECVSHYSVIVSDPDSEEVDPVRILSLSNKKLAECVNACRYETFDHDVFGYHLLSFLGYIFQAASLYDINLADQCLQKIRKNEQRGTRGRQI